MRLSILLLTVPAWATTTISFIEPTATQAVIAVSTNQPGNCTYAASEGSTLGASVNDVNPSLFPGSNSDSRPGAIPGQSISSVVAVHTFVLGTRGQAGVQTSSFDNRAYSRALQMVTRHTVGVTCGSDAQVIATFSTVNPPAGTAYREPLFWRPSPGDYAYPSQNWTTRGVCTIDPETGACVKLAALPGDFLSNPASSQAQTFLPSLVGGTGWTGSRQTWSYSGTSQGFLFLPIIPLSTANGSVVISEYSTSGPTWLQLTATLSGSAPGVLVCLSVDGGQTCASGKISQPITGTPTAYTIGTQTPVLESWRNGPRPPISQSDIVTQTGTVTKSGATVTWAGGNYFLPTRWHAGSTIVLGTSTCVIASMQSDISLTLASPSCATDGSSIAYSATNFGFLIQASAAASGTVAVSAPAWAIGSSGWVGMPSAGTLNDVCQAVSVTGPTGQGNLCSPGSSYGAPNEYSPGNPVFWIGQDGTVNLIGMNTGATTPGGGFTDGACGEVNMVFDGVSGGRFYCGRYTLAAATFGIFYVQYYGSYTPSNPGFGTLLPNSTSVEVTADVNALVRGYDQSGNFAAFEANYLGTGKYGVVAWNVVGWQANGTNGALLLQARLDGGLADHGGFWAVLSLDTNTIIGTMCTYCGGAGAVNRWSGDHSGFGFRQYQTMVDGTALQLEGPAGPFGIRTAGTLRAAPWSSCPNAYGASGNNCSPLTLSSLTPADPAGNTLPGASGPQQLLLGDYLLIDGECVRIVGLSGLSATVFRNQGLAFSGNGQCGQKTSHSANLPATAYTSAANEFFWEWATDPNGAALVHDPVSADCHLGYSMNAYVLGCINGNYPSVQGKPIRLGPFPQNPLNPFFYVNFDAAFGDRWVPYQGSQDNCMQTHPSKSQELVTGLEQLHFIDNRPYMGWGPNNCSYAPTFITPALIGTYTYKIPASNISALGYSYRVHSWLVTSNQKVAVDVSGPASVLHDTIADNYKFCTVLIAGECVPGSAAGDVYVNFPYVSQVGPYGCYERSPMNDIDIAEMYAGLQGIQEVQFGHGEDDQGKGVRFLTTAFSRRCTQSVFWNSREVALGGWIYTTVDYLDGVNAEPVLIRKPLTPPMTNFNLAEFIPVQFEFPAGAPGDNVTIQLGYAEYDQGQLATGQVPPCNPRNEGCFIDSTGGNPFLWASETQRPASCSNGCNVVAQVLPAPGGRVVYYRVIRANGATVDFGPLEIMIAGSSQTSLSPRPNPR